MASSSSILGSVARHEQELLATLNETDREAQAIVDDAHADARKHLESEGAKLSADVADIRRDAEAVRTAAYDAVVQESEDKLESLRASARGKAGAVAQEVLKLILPKGAGGRA